MRGLSAALELELDLKLELELDLDLVLVLAGSDVALDVCRFVELTLSCLFQWQLEREEV